MQDVDLLIAIAQLAVALAGFTGVASMLRASQSSAQVRAQSERLRGMLEMALIVGGAALLPIVLDRAGIDEAIAWRIAATLFLVTAVPSTVLGIRRAIRVNRDAGTPERSNVRWTVFVIAMALSIVTALVSGIIGVMPMAAGYVVALYVLLVWSGVLFSRFFMAAGA